MFYSEVDVGASRRVAKTADLGTPTRAIASKLPHLLLLTPMVYITTVYLPNLCAIAFARGGLSARLPDVACVLAQRHRVNRINWTRTHQRRQHWNSVLFFSGVLLFIKVMAGFGYAIEEMKVMPTVAYLNGIVLGVGVLYWSGRALHMDFVRKGI